MAIEKPEKRSAEKLIPGNGAKHCEEAVRKVMRELTISDPRMERVISRAIEGYRAKTDAPPNCNAVAEAMVKARHGYLGLGDLLRYKTGVRKFIALGMWDDPGSWELDKEELRRQRRL